MAPCLDASGALCEASFRETPGLADGDGPVAEAFRRWFEGVLGALAGLALAPRGPALHQSVWAELGRIGPGTTRSYGEIARALGGATHRGPCARSVDAANAANPVAIAIPCHRVIGADGRLTGCAAGLARKAWLLAHEGCAPAQGLLL
jgi:methylated-DNA-[protein]-cysteine S-methyltransferase